MRTIICTYSEKPVCAPKVNGCLEEKVKVTQTEHKGF